MKLTRPRSFSASPRLQRPAKDEWLRVDGSLVSYQIIAPDWPADVNGQDGSYILGTYRPSVETVIDEIGAADWIAELDRLNEQRRIAAKRHHEYQLAQQQALIEQGTNILYDWAQAHGDVVPPTKDQPGKWVRELEILWIDAHVPEGYTAWNRPMKVVDNDNPAPADLEALKAAEALCDRTIVLSAQLGRAGGFNARPEHRQSVVGVVVAAPTGYSRTFWRRVPQGE
ncbi:hypothetical protein OHB26_05565 [Nocardia sp. NBC_01503]|uniref:hypothetical protein n=1 Tax=Nocardia sp. NBC_01503 TaxID=2975997 RepID=UPI002E7BD765|nr:hypothetical protein [Nocardia sp. NBC_01503]WTL33693.1 hypothetical protein OHB26_05565 [Nocardia sp. NBC_01503]